MLYAFCWVILLPCHPPTGKGHFRAKPFFPVNTPTFLKHSHTTPIRLWR